MKKHKGVEVKHVTSDFLALCYKHGKTQASPAEPKEIVLPKQEPPKQKSLF